jgi:hypothetical protein
MRKYVQKHFITLRVLPAIVLVVGLKLAFFLLEVPMFGLSGYFYTLVLANVFLLGFLISGVLPDYKAAEKIPGEIAASLDTLLDEFQCLYVEKKLDAAKVCMEHTAEVSVVLNEWFHEQTRTRKVMEALSEYSRLFSVLEPHIQAPFLVRMKQEVSAIRRLVLRVRNIREIHFTGSAYAVAEVFTILVIGSMVFVDSGALAESLFVTGLVTYVLAYLLLLIRDLDNPFDYTHNPHLSDEIAIAPIGAVSANIQKSLVKETIKSDEEKPR